MANVLDNPLIYQAFRRSALAVQARFNDFDPVIGTTDPGLVDARYRPVFMFSPPRVGSTLVYQYLHCRYQLSYISNLMAVAPRFMVRLCRLMPSAASGHADINADHYGFVSGIKSPSEALKIVQKWFLGEDWHDNRDSIRRTVAGISLATGRPFFYKNPSLSPCIERVLNCFPGARVILLKRDVRLVAQSILLAKDFLGLDEWRWWSVDLPGHGAMAEQSPVQRAVWQAHQTSRHIERAVAVGGNQMLRIRYEDFCRNPAAIVTEVGEAFTLRAVAPAVKLPDAFPVAARVRVDKATWNEIEAACEALEVPSEDRDWPV